VREHMGAEKEKGSRRVFDLEKPIMLRINQVTK
jgi:hypothetical protein